MALSWNIKKKKNEKGNGNDCMYYSLHILFIKKSNKVDVLIHKNKMLF